MAFEKRVTIKQVAKEAGVSPQTVSRVVNNHPDVSSETRVRVQQIIKRLAYQPSSIARTLLRGHSKTLGVVGSGLELYGPSQALVGIERQAGQMGYALYLTLMQEPTRSSAEPLRNLLSHQVDGIIWAVPELDDNRSWIPHELARLSVPIVFLSMHPDPALSIVAIDNRTGGRLATEHLVGQGYRRIGLIAGPCESWEANQRCLGWEDALRQAGIPVEKDLKAPGDWSPLSGEQGMRRLLEQCPDLEAVFIGNDQMSVGALQAACQIGRRVPEDLALVGFDDIPEAAYLQPPLTTVRQDMVEVGSVAVRELCRVIEADEHGQALIRPKNILIQPQLIVRASSMATSKVV